MGIGSGLLTGVHVGGVLHRWEYIMAGQPQAQIGVAEPLAKPGETVLSPEAWALVRAEFALGFSRGLELGSLWGRAQFPLRSFGIRCPMLV